MEESKNKGWTVKENIASILTNNLEVGESTELEIVLDWIASKENLGAIQNISEITETENGANYEETTKEDNKDNVEVIIAISTGNNNYIIMICVLVTAIVGFAGRKIYLKKEDATRVKGRHLRK